MHFHGFLKCTRFHFEISCPAGKCPGYVKSRQGMSIWVMSVPRSNNAADLPDGISRIRRSAYISYVDRLEVSSSFSECIEVELNGC